MMKKLFSALIISALLLSLGTVIAFADNNTTEIIPGNFYKQGDVNLDSKVNIKDATLIQKHLAKIKEISELQLSLADVDGKKGVNVKDATYLQKWLAGIVEELHKPQGDSQPSTITISTNETGEQTTASSVKESQSAEATTVNPSSVATKPTETTTVKPSTIVPDPTEATTVKPSTIVTDPTEAPTTEATKPTRDPNKPIELPFIPVK